jgi:hypothetical protein
MELSDNISKRERAIRKRGWVSHVRMCETRPDGYLNILDEYRDARGLLHRLNGPARIVQDTKTKRKVSTYYNNGVIEFHKGPAVIIHKNGRLISETYFDSGRRHRYEGPAEIKYLPDGSMRFAHYIRGRFVKTGEESPTLRDITKFYADSAPRP